MVGDMLGFADYGTVSGRDLVHVGNQAKVCLANLLCSVPGKGNRPTGFSPTVRHDDESTDYRNTIIHVRYISEDIRTNNKYPFWRTLNSLALCEEIYEC